MNASVLELDCRRAFIDDDGRLCTEISVKNQGPDPTLIQEVTLARRPHELCPTDAPLATVPQINVALGAGDAWEGTFWWSVEVSSRVRADGAAAIRVGSSGGRERGARFAQTRVSLAGASTKGEPTVIRLRRRHGLQTLGAVFSLGASVIMFHAASDGDGLGSAFAGFAYLVISGWLVRSIAKRQKADRPRLILGPDWLVLEERRGRAIVGSPPREVLVPFDTIVSLEARPATAPTRLVVHTQNGKNPFLLSKELPAAWAIPALLEAIEERRPSARK